MKAIKATLNKIDRNIVKYQNAKGIFNNGDDNAYSEKIERYTQNSATALATSELMSSYLAGKGLNTAIGVFDIDSITEDTTNFCAFFIHVNYNAFGDIDKTKVLQFSECRVGEQVSDGKFVKILHKAGGWHDNKKDAVEYDVFNPSKEVVLEQIKKAGGLENYRGQIAYFTQKPRLIYPLARIHAVTNDASAETAISDFKYSTVHNRFISKMVVVTPPLNGDDIIGDFEGQPIGDDDEELPTTNNGGYSNYQDESQEFKDALKDFGGVDGMESVLHVELEHSGDDITKAIHFQEFKTSVDPDFFTALEKSCEEKILTAFKNCPLVLVKTPDNSFFSQSGEALIQAKIFYQEATEKERSFIEESLNRIWVRHEKYDNQLIKINPLIQVRNDGQSINQ